MQTIIDISDRLLKSTTDSFVRYLYHNISWEERLVGIVGAKGTGKTTMLLQYIKRSFADKTKALYVSLDHIWFSKNSLWNLAEQFNAYGGTHLFLDEVHKYPAWAREIKNIYDSFPDLSVVFTGSSMLEIYQQSVDLSRRVVRYELKGLSFREFLEYEDGLKLEKYSLEDILSHHREIANSIIFDFKILPAFKKYLQTGYYPFYKKSKGNYYYAIQQSINKTLEEDLPAIEQIEYATILKLKKMLSIVAEMVPYQPNTVELSASMETARQLVVKYLYLLDRAGILMCLQDTAEKLNALSKPEKVYLENTNIIYSLAKENANQGNLRETFFANQLQEKHSVKVAKKGDFVVDNQYTFEIGGRNKTGEQIKNTNNAFVVADDIESGLQNKIPLWLFGFLY
ncbi:MAG: AAA family ATPase [Dysgonamonadaceae bacterium]|jgi:predicted AAA+ superfamily ATPase|nr:AAA family ATPase [Dysgonamonadaceae bacterium]